MNIIYGRRSGLRAPIPTTRPLSSPMPPVGQNALSSRIGKRVRDTEGLSYSLASRFQMSDALDGIWTSMSTSPRRTWRRRMTPTKDEFEKFCREGVTDDEVAVAEAAFRRQLPGQPRIERRHRGVARGRREVRIRPCYLDEFPERIRKVTREQVNAAIKAHLHPDKLNLVIAGDLDKLPD